MGAGPVTSGGSESVSELRVGSPPSPAYLTEIYESRTDLVTDHSVFRVRAVGSASATRVGEFWGVSAIRAEAADAPGVVDGGPGVGTDPYLYAVRARVSPRVGRNSSSVDDVVGVAILNKSFTDWGSVSNGTEGLYVGHSGGATKDWNSAIGIDTIADNGIALARGPYGHGILITGGITTAAMRVPNNTLFVGRNAADNANLSMMKISTLNNLVLGSGSTPVVAGNPTIAASTHLEVHGLGVADGATYAPHIRVLDTSAFAANVGGGIAFGGYQDATPNYRSFGLVAALKENATSGNRAGYFVIATSDATNGLTERVRVSSTGMVSIAAQTNVGGAIELNELSSDVAAGAANTARFFAKDNGSGKTLLCVRFATGTVQTIATEP